MNQKTSIEVARALLKAGAVKFYPDPKDAITVKHGIKSPIDYNNGEVTKNSEYYNPILNGFIDVVNNLWDEYDSHADVIIVGVPMGALFWASCIAHDFGAGFAFIRKEESEDGMKVKLEKHPRIGKGSKVIIVEDLIVTGSSCLEVVETLRAAEAEVLGVVAIVSYGCPQAYKNFDAEGVQFKALTDYSTIVKVGINMKMFSAEDGAVLENWHNAPENWGE